MSETKTFSEQFLSSNPLPPTPNDFVNWALSLHRIQFCMQWQYSTYSATWRCAEELKRCAETKKRAAFERYWRLWHEVLLGQVRRSFRELVQIGTNYPECGLPDPAVWALDCLHALLKEQIVLPNGENIVDHWIKIVLLSNALRSARSCFAYAREKRRTTPAWMDLGGLADDASAEPEGSDRILEALREEFRQTIWLSLEAMMWGACAALAGNGWRPPANDQMCPPATPAQAEEAEFPADEPTITLRDLERLPRRDKRLQGIVPELRSLLEHEIKSARVAVALNKVATIADIRKQFPILRNATDVEIKTHTLSPEKCCMNERTAAIEMMHRRCPGYSLETIEKYARGPVGRSELGPASPDAANQLAVGSAKLRVTHSG
jgi:hypothetical protein